MALKTENDKLSKSTSLIWASIALLFVAGLWADHHYSGIASSIRIAAWIVWAIVLLAVALQTTQGQQFFHFTKEVKTELRKVVWPTRQETVQMTVIVMIVVIITGLILWGIDSLLLLAINWLTG